MKLFKKGCIDCGTLLAAGFYIVFISTVLSLSSTLITKDLSICKYSLLIEGGILAFGIFVGLHFVGYNEYIKEIKSEKLRKFLLLE